MGTTAMIECQFDASLASPLPGDVFDAGLQFLAFGICGV